MSRHHGDHKVIPWRRWARLRVLALDRDQWRCTRCGHPDRLEVHHVKPLAAGGAPLALANLSTVCRWCHMGAHLSPERRAWREFMRGAA